MKTPEEKKTEAQARQAAARSPQEQLKHLDALGLTAKKERTKIAKRLAAPPPKAKQEKKA